MTNTLTEIFFRGVVSKVNFEFLNDLVSKSSRIRCDIPEIQDVDYDTITSLLKSSEYIDIAFDSCRLNFISNVFVNLVLDKEKIELLFFLDLKDTGCDTHKESLDVLIVWAKDFGLSHNFNQVICQPDNAEEDEFYFKNGEYGFFYNRLK